MKCKLDECKSDADPKTEGLCAEHVAKFAGTAYGMRYNDGHRLALATWVRNENACFADNTLHDD